MKWCMVAAVAVSFLCGGMAFAHDDNLDLDALLGDVGAATEEAVADPFAAVAEEAPAAEAVAAEEAAPVAAEAAADPFADFAAEEAAPAVE